MFVVDQELTQFIESGIGVLVGTVDATGHPRLAYAWGPRVHPGGARVSVYVDRERSEALLRGREVNPQIATTFTDPISLRSVQLKGRILEVAEPNDAERTWVNRHREAFATTTALIGDHPHAIRNLWMDETVRVDLSVERAYDQTPGPNAGAAL